MIFQAPPNYDEYYQQQRSKEYDVRLVELCLSLEIRANRIYINLMIKNFYIHTLHLITYRTFTAIRYDYPEYDYMYDYTTLRRQAVPLPSILDHVTNFVSSGKCNQVPNYHFCKHIQ